MSSISSPTLDGASLFNFTHSGECVMAYHLALICTFLLSPFYILIDYAYILFCEMPIQDFCPC